MSIQPGQILKNLIPSEPVAVNQVQQLSSMVFIKFTGVNTKEPTPR